MGMKFDIGDFAKTLGTVSESDTPQLIYVPLEDLIADDQNFFSMSEIPDLASNIELCGLQQPLRVRRSGDKFRIVSGHRRHAALQMLVRDGKTSFSTVPCIEETDEASPAMQELRLIFANSATRKLSSADLSEMAERVERLLYQLKEEGVEFPGRMRDQVAAACQTTGTKLAELKKIRECLKEPFQSQFKENKITQSAAYGLARLPDYVQEDLAAALGRAKNPVAGVAVDNLLRSWKEYYKVSSNRVCAKSALACDNVKGFLKATAKSAYSWQYCDGRCCCDCRDRHECAGACQYAKELNKQDDADRAAEKAREKKQQEKKTAAHKAANQKIAQRLIRAIDAAGLDDETRVRSDYGSISVKTMRNYAIGDFGERSIYSDDNLTPYYAAGVRELAEQLHCSADYILGLTEDLRPAEPCEGQLHIAAWMPGGTTPAHDCTVVLEFAISESKVVQRLGRFNAAARRFELNRGDAVEMEPIRWIELPE